MQLYSAVSLALIDSSITHCFVQQSEITNSCAMFKGGELKVQHAMGHESPTKKKIHCQSRSLLAWNILLTAMLSTN